MALSVVKGTLERVMDKNLQDMVRAIRSHKDDEFGALTPLEPRLGKKLIEPLTNLIHRSITKGSILLLMAAISSVLISISSGIPNLQASIQLCVQKLRVLIEDSDQNCLLAMTKILKHHPKSVQSHKDLVLNCLDDRDESIRLRALDLLLHGMSNRKNLVDIIKTLMRHVSIPSLGAHYKAELVTKIVQICSQEDYQLIASFEWYVSILVQLTQISEARNGELLASQLLDVAIRVPTVRKFATNQMALLLKNCHNLNKRNNAVSHVLYAAAWICGEYSQYLDSQSQTLEDMLSAALTSGLQGHIQYVLLMNALKLYGKEMAAIVRPIEESFSNDSSSSSSSEPKLDQPETQATPEQLDSVYSQLKSLTADMMQKFNMFVHSADLEVQERAVSIYQLLSLVAKQLNKAKNCSQSIRPNISSNSLTSSVVENGSNDIPAEETVHKNDSVDLENSISNRQMESTQNEIENEAIAIATTNFKSADFDEQKLDSVIIPETESSLKVADASESPKESTDFQSAFVRSLQPITSELLSLFAGELNPVAARAQKKVPVPEGLDLDAWINDPPISDSINSNKSSSDKAHAKGDAGSKVLSQFTWTSDENELSQGDNKKKKKSHKKKSTKKQEIRVNNNEIFQGYVDSELTPKIVLTKKQIEASRMNRLREQESNPHYLKATNSNSSSSQNNSSISYQKQDSDNLSTNQLNTSTDKDEVKCETMPDIFVSPDHFVSTLHEKKESKNKETKKKSNKKSKKSQEHKTSDHDFELISNEELDNPSVVTVSKVFDAPEGVILNEDSEEDVRDPNDPHAKLNIALDDLFLNDKPDIDSKQNKEKRKKKRNKVEATENNKTVVLENSIEVDEFADLLASGTLIHRASCKVRYPLAKQIIDDNGDNFDEAFDKLINKLQAEMKSSLIEAIDHSASLCCKDKSGEPVCLLVKMNISTGSVSIEGKSTKLNLVEDVINLSRNLTKY